MNPRYALVASRAAHRCEYCRAPEAIFNFPFEVEHVIPLSRAGVDGESSWALIGATPIGRATVTCLAFNSDNQLWARKQWMRLGLFP